MAEEPRTDETAQATRATPPRRRWKWPMIILGAVVLVPAAIFAIWAWITLSYTYSSGDRAGYVQKFSKKGWLCKTWEGELAMVNIPGAMQERWTFTVRNDSIANEVLRMMGNRVSLSYEEHRGVPTSCFGDTDYFVSGVRHVPEP